MLLLFAGNAGGEKLHQRMAEGAQRKSENAKKFWDAITFVGGFFGSSNESSEPELQTTLAVIGAGMSRTGTESTEQALTKLGYKVYDTQSLMQLDHGNRWVAAVARAVADPADWTLLDGMIAEIEAMGFNATLDFPMNILAPLLARRRPLAKVLLTRRQTDEAWLASLFKIQNAFGRLALRPFTWLVDFDFSGKLLRLTFPGPWEGLQDTVPASRIWRPVPWFEMLQGPVNCCDLEYSPEPSEKKELWVALARKLQTDLEAQLGPSSPEGRFLVFGVHEGWSPLHQFLQLEGDAPQEAFPHVNQGAAFEYLETILVIVGAGFPLWLLLGAVIPFVLVRGAVRILIVRRVCCKQKPRVVKDKKDQ